MIESVPKEGVSLELLEVRTYEVYSCHGQLLCCTCAVWCQSSISPLLVSYSVHLTDGSHQLRTGVIHAPHVRHWVIAAIVQVDQADKLADPRVELRVRHRHTVRADTANEQVASPSMEAPSLLELKNNRYNPWKWRIKYLCCPSSDVAAGCVKCVS